MTKVAALSLFAVVTAFAQGQNTASTRGRCSPAVSQAGGNVTITYLSGSCPELDAKTVATLKDFSSKFPRTLDRLNELLDKKDVELASRDNEVQEWIGKYEDLANKLAENGDDSALGRQAAAKLQDGDLEGAGKLLDEIISRGESRLDRLAQDHFNRGRVYELQFRVNQALEHYAKAYRYRPENTSYAFAYAHALANQNQHTEATIVYERLLATYRKLAQDNPATYLPDVARNLNNLGSLYYSTQRIGEADKVYTEALDIRRKLAQDNPAAYLRDVAATLNNLGILYRDTQRFGEADRAYTEALATYRKLAQDNPVAYLPNVATALNNLGVLYRDTQRFGEADKVYTEALAIHRKLAQDNPAAYLPDVALTPQ